MVNIRKIEETLQESIFEVFEKMFYLFLDSEEGEVFEPYRKTHISFAGPIKGDLWLNFNKEIAFLMTENMLNMRESEVTEGIIEDCLKEATNMVLGNFLRRYDPEGVFDLTLPLVKHESLERWPPAYSLKKDFIGENGAIMEVFLALSPR